MGLFIHFYIIFGTNLLTQGPVKIVVFCLFQCFTEKEYQAESQWNETFTRIVPGAKAIQKTWGRSLELHKEARRQEGAPRGVGAPPPSWAPRTSTTYFFRIYILLYPRNIREIHETTFPPPQPSEPMRSHLGAFFDDLSEGESIMVGFYINTIASPMKRE